MIKLLYITNSITGSGGLERVLSIKSSLLADDYNYDVHLLQLNDIGEKSFFPFSKSVKMHSIIVNGNAISYFYQYKSGIQKIVTQLKPDIILVCDDGLKGLFLPHIIRAKARWVYESHASVMLSDKGNGLKVVKKLEHKLKQFLAQKFSKIILLTEGNKREWKVDNIAVIPNPLPFVPDSIATLKEKRVLAVGSYSHNKGYDLLLNIWSKIEQDFPDWKLMVYGKGVKENLKTGLEQLNLQNVSLFNAVPNIESKYLESSIFVLPSRSEGFGMVLIEAMSCGLPVISFDCPNGPRDIISNNIDGYLIEDGNEVHFAEKLEKLLADRNLRVKMGSVGRETSMKYLPSKIVMQWDFLFKSMLTNTLYRKNKNV